MTAPFFHTVDSIVFAGPESQDPLTFRFYDRERVVLGRPDVRERLRQSGRQRRVIGRRGPRLFSCLLCLSS